MAHARRVIRCHGCGAILQSDNKKLPGFISKSVVENGAPKIPYCNSCYEKMLSLNTSQLPQEVDKATLKILKDAVATDALIIWVVDLFSFNGTLNPDVVKKVKKLNVVVFGTHSHFAKTSREVRFVREDGRPGLQQPRLRGGEQDHPPPQRHIPRNRPDWLGQVHVALLVPV